MQKLTCGIIALAALTAPVSVFALQNARGDLYDCTALTGLTEEKARTSIRLWRAYTSCTAQWRVTREEALGERWRLKRRTAIIGKEIPIRKAVSRTVKDPVEAVKKRPPPPTEMPGRPRTGTRPSSR